MFDRLYPMLDGPQERYTPRHKEIKCCMVLAQGAPGFLFRGVSKIMRRLNHNGFNNIGIIRETMIIDLKNITNNKLLLRFGSLYTKHQTKKMTD